MLIRWTQGSHIIRVQLTSRVQIELLLSRIELMFGEMHVPEPAFGATVDAAVSALVYNLVNLSYV